MSLNLFFLAAEIHLKIIHLVCTQNFPKLRTCTYQGVRNVFFFGKFWAITKQMIPYPISD